MAGVDARWFMEHKLSKPGIGLGFFGEAFDEYVRCFNWKTIKGSCADYRACVTCDLEMDTADFTAGRKIACPALVLWGATGGVGRHHQPMSVWPDYCADLRGGAALPSGHYLVDEAPAETEAALRGFFTL